MNKDALIQQLMATYVDEVDEEARALNRDLLALEKAPPEAERLDLFKSLLRTAHTLKGASRSVNVGPVETICHQLEEVFANLQHGELAEDPELFALLFSAVDAIDETGRRLRREESIAGGAIAELLPKLEAVAAGKGRHDGPLKSPAPLAPPAVARPVSAPETQVQTVSMAKSAEAAAGAAKPSAVRVAAAKLDALLAHQSEFDAAYGRLLLRMKDMETLSRFLSQWQTEWSAASASIRATLRRRGIERGNVLSAPLRPMIRQLPALLDQTAEHFRYLRTESSRLLATLAADMHDLQRAAGALGEELRRVRMLPFAEACLGLDRMCRDLAKESGKEVDLIIEAEDVEIDRSVLEGLKDSLRHLVRNAICHGIESPDERGAAEKPRRGCITITASMRGSQVEVTVADDGRGLDLVALREIARNKGLLAPATDRDFAQLIFVPGVTTAKVVSGVSGRGVGLDIVNSRAEAAHGSVDVAFEVGRGTRISLILPLTLTALRSLLVKVGGQTFGFVGTTIERMGRINLAELKSVVGRGMCAIDGRLLPVASLAKMLGLREFVPLEHDKSTPFVVISAGDRQVLLLVDEHLAEQEITIKKLGSRIECVPYISGATILPTGKIALVLNAANLVRGAIEHAAGPFVFPAPAAPRKRLLVADDSVTTRTLIASILTGAGYDVAPAADGMAAWQLLQESGADLVITDVAMPRMDGFALTEAVRKSTRFRELPVVLVTSRETDEDKARGAAAGATAYLLKSRFDQRALLETIAQLL